MSFFDVPLHNPIGFGPVDFIELAIAAILFALALVWGPWIAPFAARFARKTVWCMISLAGLSVALRLALLARAPVPTPDIYDEFGHLLVADTLRHWRLGNPVHPMHRFFETFFVLQQPSYSSIYPVGNGLALAAGWNIFGLPWAGVLICTAMLCALCYWMLRGWTTPGWALAGGMLAVFQFGPLNQWTNSYWGGGFAAAAGCLVYGALPRLRNTGRVRFAVVLGIGLGMNILSRPYESVFLALSVLLFYVPARLLGIAALTAFPAIGLTLLQNKSVTGEWLRLPYSLSQYQYGVPAALTFEREPTPHLPLTPQQELDYRMQRNFHPGPETLRSYFLRLGYRARYYRFYFYPPLYLVLGVFLVRLRRYRWAWVPLTCAIFALGTNFFPAFQYHYLAAIVCLFILMAVRGLQDLSRFSRGKEAASAILFLCAAQFAFSYGFYRPDSHAGPRAEINRRIAQIPGRLLIFVRYWPQHIFQNEWVYNGADIDSQRVVWARDLGDAEDEKLEHYYGGMRTALLLEPDADPPELGPYEPTAPAVETVKPPDKAPAKPAAKPLIEMEQVR